MAGVGCERQARGCEQQRSQKISEQSGHQQAIRERSVIDIHINRQVVRQDGNINVAMIVLEARSQ